MRRALTIPLILYLGLDRVLSSPVQLQAPFELNSENTSTVENASASASEFQFSLFCPCYQTCAEVKATLADLCYRILEPPRKLQGRFLHVTDLHPDPLYRVGGSVSSGCHRKRPKKEKNRAGYLGTPYGFVILSHLLSHSENLEIFFFGSAMWRAVAEFNLEYSF